MKIMTFFRRFWILFLFIGNCSNQIDYYEPVYERFSEAPVNHILIQDRDVFDIQMDSVELIQAPESAEYDIGLGHWPIAFKDSLLIVDFNHSAIKSLDIHSGDLLNQYDFQGRGPGEYQRIDYFFATDNYFLIIDRSASKVIRYSQLWEHIDDHLLEGLNTMTLFSSYTYQAPYFYYPAGADENYLIYALNLEDKGVESEAFHNRIISLGKKPVQYNDLWIDSSPNGELLIAHTSMPMLFLYDSEKYLDQILRIHFPGIEKIERSQTSSDLDNRGGINGQGEQILLNPPPIDIETDRSISMNNLIADIFYADNLIFIKYNNVRTGAENNFITILKKKDNHWIHFGSYRFYKQDGSMFSAFNLTWSEPWLYLASQFEENIIRVNVENLPRVD